VTLILICLLKNINTPIQLRCTKSLPVAVAGCKCCVFISAVDKLNRGKVGLLAVVDRGFGVKC